MYKLLAFAALAACVYAAQAGCPGCPFEDNSNSDEVLKDLKYVIEQTGLQEEVKSIEKVTKQVTGGMLYEVRFLSVSGKECAASWLSRPWESKNPLEPKAACPTA